MPRFAHSVSVIALLVTAAPTFAQVPKVVADVPAVGSLVQQVMGDLGQPHVLLPAGGNAHSYQMRPSDARALQDADLLVWIGPELTPWLDRAAGSLSQGEVLGLLAQDATHRQDYGDSAAHDHAGHDHGNDHHDHDDHSHDHDHSHDDHDHAEDGHSHSGTDPHAWLDPANGTAWLAAIAAALAEKDPENAAVYGANAAAAAETIRAADLAVAEKLAPLKDKRFVVFHDAYGYFTGHYGLQPAISISLGDASTTSAERMAAIRAEMQSEGAICAFPETAHDPAIIHSITEGTGLRIGDPLDPSGSGREFSPDLYQQLLTAMGATLAGCLSQP